MKLYVETRAILRKENKTLLLRRSTGRQAVVSRYELPGGKIEYGEQPEGAIRRLIHESIGQSAQTIQLFNVATYTDFDERDTQHTIIIYLASLSADNIKLKLGQNYDHYSWEIIANTLKIDITDQTKSLFGLLEHTGPPILNFDSSADRVADSVDLASDTLIVYSDGGSRGNPGPSSAGFVVMDGYNTVIEEGGAYLGITTNNQAEYHGVRLGLEKALELGARRVDFRIDSLLVVNQMTGVYTIKNRELWPINERIHALVSQFEKVTFTHVKREYNQLADGMVNKILNAHEKDRV